MPAGRVPRPAAGHRLVRHDQRARAPQRRPLALVGWAGLVASVLYLFNQGDILATVVPGFPVFDLAGFVGSTLWGLWVIALGVAVLRVPIRRPTADPVAATAPA